MQVVEKGESAKRGQRASKIITFPMRARSALIGLSRYTVGRTGAVVG